MEVMVNGERRTAPDGTTVSQLLNSLRIVPERVVVELNLTILKRAQHANTLLKEGDQVEIVQFVGGGATDCCKLQATGFRKLGACSLQLEARYG